MINKKLQLKMGTGCQLKPSAFIGYNESGKGSIILGNKVVIRENSIIRTCSGKIKIGHNVVINYDWKDEEFPVYGPSVIPTQIGTILLCNYNIHC